MTKTDAILLSELNVLVEEDPSIRIEVKSFLKKSWSSAGKMSRS
jgi:hypothetical protein